MPAGREGRMEARGLRAVGMWPCAGGGDAPVDSLRNRLTWRHCVWKDAPVQWGGSDGLSPFVT